MSMNWEQKFKAIQALSEATLHMREPGDWSVLQLDMDISGGTCVRSDWGHGTTPVDAIENHWVVLTELADNEYVLVRYTDKRPTRRVR